jgi:hypothetical protein
MGATDRPVVTAYGALSGAKIKELLKIPFPAQLHFRMELWKKNAWIDDLKEATEWDVFVQPEPSSKYSVQRQHGQHLENFGSFPTMEAAARVAEQAYVVGQVGRGVRGGQYYYSVRLEVSALQSKDIDVLEAWMRGPGQGAIQGKKSIWGAFRTGVGTLMSRIIGGERSRYEARSGVFIAG